MVVGYRLALGASVAQEVKRDASLTVGQPSQLDLGAPGARTSMQWSRRRTRVFRLRLPMSFTCQSIAPNPGRLLPASLARWTCPRAVNGMRIPAENDPASMLNFISALLKLRREHPALGNAADFQLCMRKQISIHGNNSEDSLSCQDFGLFQRKACSH
jgi:hypothetical protein